MLTNYAIRIMHNINGSFMQKKERLFSSYMYIVGLVDLHNFSKEK